MPRCSPSSRSAPPPGSPSPCSWCTAASVGRRHLGGRTGHSAAARNQAPPCAPGKTRRPLLHAGSELSRFQIGTDSVGGCSRRRGIAFYPRHAWCTAGRHRKGCDVIGRTDECAAIGRLLADARSGRSGTLVLSGEPGVGKSVLIEHAVESAEGMRVLEATGVETEVDLAFAGLDQLVRPVLPLVERLPARQADALLGALGLSDHPSEDRFLVGAATLSVLSEVAEDTPVLCVVEDAHWLDQPSSEALAFAARRLEAEGVTMLVATRGQPWSGLPSAPLGGFGPEEVGELLRCRAETVAPSVRDRLIAETGGNPLALVELGEALTADQLTGKEALPHPLPVKGRVQEAFLARARSLPEPSQTSLLVAAADDTADLAVVLAAAAELGAGPEALEPIERAGLVRVEGDVHPRIVFRHPLVRAAAYQHATFGARSAAHRALAAVLDGDGQTERRAWHMAAAVVGSDDSVAALLERSGRTARQRGGYAVAAAAFERAAELSTTRARRAQLTVAAAQSAFQAGQGQAGAPP